MVVELTALASDGQNLPVDDVLDEGDDGRPEQAMCIDQDETQVQRGHWPGLLDDAAPSAGCAMPIARTIAPQRSGSSPGS